MHVRCEVLPTTWEGAETLVLQGELDIADQSTLRASLARFAQERPLVVDLSGVTYMDSTVFHVLLEAWNERKDSPGAMAIRPSTNQHVRKLFKLTGFDRVFTFV
ncbi:MAG: hypothetical protein NVSMB31_06750 [Vulcanimicrobiaceae bacterium]